MNKQFTDLSGYDFLKLKMAVSSRDIYQIKIKTYLDGHSTGSDSNTWCPLEKALVMEDFMKEYIIKKKYNLSFKQLLNKIRLMEAARLLKETDRNITDIAMNLGFSSSSYFFQVFKSAYTISPSDFRKQYNTGTSKH